jgi:hypothetical protein
MTNAMPAAKSEPEWGAFVAIDWADQKHYWKLVRGGRAVSCRYTVRNGNFVLVVTHYAAILMPTALRSWSRSLMTL